MEDPIAPDHQAQLQAGVLTSIGKSRELTQHTAIVVGALVCWHAHPPCRIARTRLAAAAVRPDANLRGARGSARSAPGGSLIPRDCHDPQAGHRQPVRRASSSIGIEDSEAVLRAIRLTPPDQPIDLILHTPGGLVLAAEQIAKALVERKRSEEHTSELQSRLHLVCRLLLEKKKIRLNTQNYKCTNRCTLPA